MPFTLTPWSFFRRLLRLALFALCAGHVHAAPPATLDPAEYVKPRTCPPVFKYDEKTFSCEKDEAALKALPIGQCTTPGLMKTAQDTCAFDPKAAPNPACKALNGYTATLTGAGKDAACRYEWATSVSAPGDYVGDCITKPRVDHNSKPETFLVTNQRSLDNDDRELTLVPGSVRWKAAAGARFWSYGCKATSLSDPPRKMRASELMDLGSTRQGYAYGMLTMPYKYYPGRNAFQTGVPIGGYLGWRSGQAGSGSTLALAVTLSSVKANAVDRKTLDADGKPTVTGTTEVAALSGAIGMVFDILKSPQGKAFKAGFFFGKDYVNTDGAIDYPFNRRGWIALQLGYDFTDN